MFIMHQFECILLFNPHVSLHMAGHGIVPILQMRKLKSRKLGKLPRVTQKVHKSRIWAQVSYSRTLTLTTVLHSSLPPPRNLVLRGLSRLLLKIFDFRHYPPSFASTCNIPTEPNAGVELLHLLFIEFSLKAKGRPSLHLYLYLCGKYILNVSLLPHSVNL